MALVFLLYLPVLKFKFLINFDDDTLILNSPEVLNLNWENLVYIFSHTKDGLYHPLTSLSWAIEHALFGLDPYYFHLDNLLIHLLCVYLFYGFCKRLTNDGKLAVLAAGIFAIHPMHVENIAWISARKDLVVCLFFLLSLRSYLSYSLERKTKDQIAYLLFFILALLSKASAMVLPGLFILIDWYLGKDKWVPMIKRQIIPFILSLSALALTLYAQKSAGFIAQSEEQFSLLDRFFILSYSLSYYLVQTIVPFFLAPKNFYPDIYQEFLPWWYYLAPLFLGGLAYLLWRNRKDKLLLFSIAFLVISIAPLLKIIPTGNDVVSNRYAYMAYFGIYIFLAYKVIHLKSNWVKILAFLWIGALVFQSYRYQNSYSDSLSVWSRVIENAKKNSWEQAMAYNERGQVYLKAGNQNLAIQDINKALKIEPELFRALLNRANLYELNQQLELALKDLNQALEKYPNAIEAMRIRSAVYGKMNRPELAIADLNSALELNPNRADLLNNRGIAYSMTKQYDLAEADFNLALENNPYYIDAKINRANLYLSQEKIKKAKNAFLQILDEQPENFRVSLLLSSALLNEGKLDSSQQVLESFAVKELYAGEIAQHYAQNGYYKLSLDYYSIALGEESIRERTLYQRALSYKELGEYQNAIDDLMAILEKMPNPQFFYEIAELYWILERPEKACEFWNEAAKRKHQQAAQRIDEHC